MSGQARPGNANAVAHGGYSSRLIDAKARAARRRFRDGIGVKACDLDGIAKEWLRQYALGVARYELLPLDSSASTAAYNASVRALIRLETRLKELGLVQGRAARKPAAALERYLAERSASRDGAA